MAKGKWLHPNEKKFIRELFSKIGSADKVAELSGREKSTVLKLVKHTEHPPKAMFSWESFNNSII